MVDDEIECEFQKRTILFLIKIKESEELLIELRWHRSHRTISNSGTGLNSRAFRERDFHFLRISTNDHRKRRT